MHIVYLLLGLQVIGVILGAINNHQDEINKYLAERAKKKVKTEAQRFYSSNAWYKAKREVKALQMEISGLDFIFCEDCGITSKDIDDSGKPVVLSIGHNKARSKYKHLALVIDNLFVQCMSDNLAQGTDDRLKTGYNTV